MNKKIIYLSVFLVLALFLISACNQAVGSKIKIDEINKGAGAGGDCTWSCRLVESSQLLTSRTGSCVPPWISKGSSNSCDYQRTKCYSLANQYANSGSSLPIAWFIVNGCKINGVYYDLGGSVVGSPP